MFKPSLLSTAIAASVIALGQSAFAQESENAQDILVEEVVVTGIRASLAKAVDIKREKVEIVESIVAEDIGKFPDNNVVEALQRVPGIQVTDRASGEVNSISIRGLNDVTTTINGRQIYISNARFYTLADTPASLINRVDVFKTRSAAQIASGIAGQIDVQTQRPFNFDGSKIVVNARGIYQDQGEEWDPSIGVLLSNRWETDSFGEIGALINFAHAETHYRDQSITSGAAFPYFTRDPEHIDHVPYARIGSGWTPGLETGLPYAAGSTLTVDGVEEEYILSRDAMFASDFSGKRERPAANISVQWAPNDSSEYMFEAFYNGYKNQSMNSLYFDFVDSNADIDFSDEVLLYEGTNIVKERTVYGANGFNSGDASTGDTDSFVYAIGGKWDIGDSLHLEAEAYTQKSRFKSEFLAVRLDRQYYGLDLDFNNGDGVPSMVVLDDPTTADVDESDLLDRGQYTLSTSWDNGGWDEGSADTVSIDGEWDIDFFGINQVKFGALYEVREAFSAGRGASLNAPGDAVVADLPNEMFTSTSGFFDGRADFPSDWLIADGDWMFANRTYIRELYGYPDPSDTESDYQAYLIGGNHLNLYRNFDVEETTADAYVELNYEYDAPGGIIDGSLGFRYATVNTDLVAYSNEDDQGNTGVYTVTEGNNSSNELLPTLVIRYNFLDDYMVRFAFTKTLRSPDFGALSPVITWNKDVTDIGYGTAGGGNLDLKPTTSTNIDLSLERYFGDGNALYATWFRRDIDGLIYGSQSEAYHDYPDDFDEDGNEIGPYRHILNSPGNTSNGVLQGLELGAVYFPDNLPSVLDGLGVQASYTILDSSQDLPIFDDTSGELTGYQESEMFGVSDSSYSVVLAYEKDTFGARLSYVWRDAFRQRNEAALFANPRPIYRRAETSMDFQFSYNVTDDFVVTFDATNLTDQKYQEYYQHQDIYNFYSGIYSRTYALGIRYTY